LLVASGRPQEGVGAADAGDKSGAILVFQSVAGLAADAGDTVAGLAADAGDKSGAILALQSVSVAILVFQSCTMASGDRPLKRSRIAAWVPAGWRLYSVIQSGL
jgi:Ca2+/H+ antiporter